MDVHTGLGPSGQDVLMVDASHKAEMVIATAIAIAIIAIAIKAIAIVGIAYSNSYYS